jgi:hypothetical protein
MILEISVFAVALFMALVALLTWKHRRDEIAARLSRGLQGYVTHRGNDWPLPGTRPLHIDSPRMPQMWTPVKTC